MMGWLSKILGESAAKPIEAIGEIVDDIHTSTEEKLEAEQVLTKVSAKLQTLQAEITKQEASHRSLFIAGWRPGIGWCCVFGFALNFLIAPILSPVVTITPANPDTMLSLALAMMGVAGLRTVEKSRGLTR